MKDEIHSYRAEFFFQIANIEHDKLILHGDIARVVQKPRKYALREFFETRRKRFRPLHIAQHFIEVADSWERTRRQRRKIRLPGDVAHRIGFAKRLIEDRVFFRCHAAEHEMEQSDQCRDITPQQSLEIFGFVALLGKIKRIDMKRRIEAHMNE